jgi:hypothetical protein
MTCGRGADSIAVTHASARRAADDSEAAQHTEGLVISVRQAGSRRNEVKILRDSRESAHTRNL